LTPPPGAHAKSPRNSDGPIDPHQRAHRREPHRRDIDPGFRLPGQPPQPAKTTLIADAEIRQSIALFASQISLGFHLAENSNSVSAQTVDHRSLPLRVAALAGGGRAGDSGEMIIGVVDPSVDRIVIVSPAINGGAIARTEGAREKLYAGEDVAVEISEDLGFGATPPMERRAQRHRGIERREDIMLGWPCHVVGGLAVQCLQP
jgi:hypothetical protein